MALMTSVDIRGGAGGADALFLNDATPRPTPGRGEALVRVKVFGLNRMDLLQREGRYPLPAGVTKTLGVEFSGVVAEVGAEGGGDGGDGTHPVSVGDEVFGLVYGGAYAEYVVASTRMLLRKPAFLSWEQAAALPENWLTALQALHEVGGFRAGDRVLWHAGASGVSIAGIQLARLAGARAVYATAGADAKTAFLERELGVAAAVNYKTSDWAAALRARMAAAAAAAAAAEAADSPSSGQSGGVDLIIDFVGAPYLQQNLDTAALDGRIVLLGLMGGGAVPAGVDISALLRKRLRIEGSSLRSRSTAYQARLRDRLEAALPHFASGALAVRIDRVFAWTDVRAAHEYMAQNVSMGKILCTIP